MSQPDPKPPGRAALMPLDEALQLLLSRVQPVADVERIDTFDADRRVLARSLVSPLRVPAYDNSAMDGYAVRCADVRPGAVLRIAQRIAAGQVGQELAGGTVARIFTGAPVPPGADAVVMQEDCEPMPDGATVRVRVQPAPGQCVRRAGEDIALGATVVESGRRLDPAALGLAAAVGFDRLDVVRPLRVALMSTGDELVMPGAVPPEALPTGSIYNSNRFFLRALLQRLGCRVDDLGIVPDRRDATVEALRAAAASNDVVLTSGGVSVGEEDHVKPAVQQLGRLDLWQIAIKPGKPFAHGRVGDAHFVGLPGNPVSSFITFLLLVRPMLLRLQGVREVDPAFQSLRAGFEWTRADRRREFLRVRRGAGGELELFANQSSGVLTSMDWADGLVDIAPGQTFARGDLVRYLPLSELVG